VADSKLDDWWDVDPNLVVCVFLDYSCIFTIFADENFHKSDFKIGLKYENSHLFVSLSVPNPKMF